MTRKWLAPTLLIAGLIFTWIVFNDLPAEVPIRWSFQGEPVQFRPKWPWAFVGPAVGLGVWVLLLGLRAVDPRRGHYEKFDETYWLLLNVMGVFFFLITILTQLWALGLGVAMPRLILGSIGVLFMAMGNYLPRLKSNWWIGIRTPWTLDSERVWRETHRVAGRAFVIGGLAAVIGSVLPAPLQTVVSVGGLVLAATVPVVYSYLAYRREKTTG